MAAWIMFGEALAEGIAKLLEAQKNKTAQAVGADIALIDTVTTAILQKNAEIKGLTIDWADPAAVAEYLKTLPTFVPIPPDAAAPPAPGPVLVPAAPAADVEELPNSVSPANPGAPGPLPVVPGE